MQDPRINLKDPWTAAILGFLIPGAGHLYQRRLFKGVLYMVCILGTFAYGMYLGQWRAVYMHTPSEIPGRKPQLVWGYLAQAGVGLPALPAIVQSRRYHSPQNLQVQALEAPVENVECEGTLTDPHGIRAEAITGVVNIDVHGEGMFIGTAADGEALELRLGGFDRFNGYPTVAPKVSAEPLRSMEMLVVDEDKQITHRLEVRVPRPALDWLEVPPTEAALGDLHRLGKVFDLAQVFTWVAGLLNILAVWDALEGPAYGYGDEEELTDKKKKKDDKKSEDPKAKDAKPEPATAAS